VRSRDLRPETSEANVHSAVASLFSAFVVQIITGATSHPPALAQAVASSKQFFAPIQAAYDCTPNFTADVFREIFDVFREVFDVFRVFREVFDVFREVFEARYMSEGNPFFPVPPASSPSHAEQQQQQQQQQQPLPYAQILQETVAGVLPSLVSVSASDTRVDHIKVAGLCG
jgi:hypothetical protein